MKVLMVVAVLFGAPDAELGTYKVVEFTHEFASMEQCVEATEIVEAEQLAKENYRGSSIACRYVAK